jgi:hypothetical protein
VVNSSEMMSAVAKMRAREATLLTAARTLEPSQLQLRMPYIAPITLPPSPLVQNLEANQASEFCKRLSKWIDEFDRTLDAEHEVGVRLVSFGQTVVFHLEGIRCWNPSLILFIGRTDEGHPVELIQHVTQISILLMTLPRRNPGEPKQPIGFLSETSEDNPGHDG